MLTARRRGYRDLKAMSRDAHDEGLRMLMAPAALPAPPRSLGGSCMSGGALVPVETGAAVESRPAEAEADSAAAAAADPSAGAIVPYNGEAAAESPGGGKGGAAKAKGRKRKRRRGGGGGSASEALEAEFALALLANDAVKGIAEHLAAARVDLPAVDVAEARALLDAQARRLLPPRCPLCGRT